MSYADLQIIELLPAFAWNSSSEKEICHRAVGKLLGLRIELKVSVKLLSDDAKTEYLTERACYAERRTRFLYSLA